MIMDDKAGRRVGDVEARHFKTIMDALEEAAEEHEVGSQTAVHIAMCFWVQGGAYGYGPREGSKSNAQDARVCGGDRHYLT